MLAATILLLWFSDLTLPLPRDNTIAATILLMWLSDLTLPGLASCGLAGARACGFWFALSGDLNSSGDALVILLRTNKIPQTGKRKVRLIQVILREEDSVQGGAGRAGEG